MACVGLTLLDCSCNVSLGYLSSCLCGDKNLVLSLRKYVKSLKAALADIEARHEGLWRRVQLDEMKGLKRRAEVRYWLSNFQKIVPQVEDVLKDSEAVHESGGDAYRPNDLPGDHGGGHVEDSHGRQSKAPWNIWDTRSWKVYSTFSDQQRIPNQRERFRCCDSGDEIGKRLDIYDEEEWMQKTENEKAFDISTSLRKMKYALLFDDIAAWGLIDHKEVTRLDDDAAWVLFQDQVGEDFLKRNPDIAALARKICAKCYGLPVLINAIAQVMAPKKTVEKWRDATDSLSSILTELSLSEFSCEEDINLSVLKFSYINLEDPKFRRCFRYCALFPENYEMIKEELIEYWECEAFVEGRDQGQDVFDKLVSARLLMENEGKVRMHDLLRKTALSPEAYDSGERAEIVYVNPDTTLIQISSDLNWSVVERVSLINNQIKEISSNDSSPNLTTLLLRNQKVENISWDFFLQMPKLLVLDLAFNQRLAQLPPSISKLHSLLYLNLSFTNIELLPVGLKELTQLMYLNLEHTLNLENIVGIRALLRLRVLRLLGSRFCPNLHFIEDLTHLGEISANGISIVETSSCLQALEISNSNIKEIKLGVTGTNPSPHPESPTSPLFNSLSQVKLCDCIGLRHLTWLLYAPNLVILHVERAKNIEEILRREIAEGVMERQGVRPFEKLTSIVFKDLEALKSICWRPLPFKSLSKIFVQLCPRLKKLPLNYERAKE
uniref:Disease resistance protein winged helix domain-containing protein n=1 Tax=Brassica oleracea var. oleracea TaxID=109376 RepID=A0A0D3B3V6_BRAOL